MVLPDWKVVCGVKESVEGADELWNGVVGPQVGRGGGAIVGGLETRPLPYDSVILLCEFWFTVWCALK